MSLRLYIIWTWAHSDHHIGGIPRLETFWQNVYMIINIQLRVWPGSIFLSLAGSLLLLSAFQSFPSVPVALYFATGKE